MTRTWNRRGFLQSGAVAVACLAGCAGNRDDRGTGTPTARGTTDGPPENGSSTATTERTPTETTEPRAVELVPTSVQSSFFYRSTTGSLDVGAVEGRQFAFVQVRPRTDSPLASDFALDADGQRFWGSLAPGEMGGPYRLVERGRGYDHDDAESGWVAFEVPDPLDAEKVVLVHDGRKRPVGEDFLTALRAPPADFELLGYDVPDRVTPDESFEVTVAVKNTGEGSGTFRAYLTLVGSHASHRAAFGVPAGERREWTRTFDPDSAEDEQVRVRFASATGDRQVTVSVPSETTSKEPSNRRK